MFTGLILATAYMFEYARILKYPLQSWVHSGLILALHKFLTLVVSIGDIGAQGSLDSPIDCHICHPGPKVYLY